jgi:CxC2 like cysteine cluster associated with KDZ transposases
LDGRGEHKNQLKCSGCSKEERQYRCQDCLGGSLFCADCIVNNHRSNIFHYIEVHDPLFYARYMLIYSLKSWNGTFFERVTLKSLNCRIQLGHPIGEPCFLKYAASGDSFVVIDTSGVHEVGLDYCGCGAGGNETTQLLRFRLYPATVHSPSTAATFRCLHHFQLLSFESKCSAYEYIQTLVRESDNTGLKNIKVC